MPNTYLFGIDIGTGGTKAVLVTSEGSFVADAFVASNPHTPSAGRCEEDPEDQVDAVCRSIRICLKEADVPTENVAAIAIAGQMAGIVGVGTNGRHVTPYDSWLDTRCTHYIKVMERTAGDEIVRKTGNPPSYNHGPKILWWKHERPAHYANIRAFVQPAGYAAMRLCGLSANEAFIDTSYLHFSGFADTQCASWDFDLCDTFEVDPVRLPRIVEPNAHIGDVTTDMADRTGLKPGTPVIAGCGDTAASFLSAGATAPGICVDVAGTASVFATTSSSFVPDVRHRMLGVSRSATPGLWHHYAYINGGGLNLEWFRKEIAACGHDGGNVSLAILDEQAAELPRLPDDPYFIPHLGGRVAPSQPALRGAWLQLHWKHKRSHLYRAVIEGIALEYGLYLNVMQTLEAGFAPQEIRVTGGGARSAFWNHLKADVLGIPVATLTQEAGAPLGAALLAGNGAGLFDDLHDTAERWIQTATTAEPDSEAHSHYAERIKYYSDAIDAINALNESHSMS